MKKYFSFLMFAILFAVGCSKESNITTTNSDESFIFNNGTYLTPTVNSEGGVLIFGFRSNTAWSVTENEEWVEVTPASGDASVTEFDVVVAKNSSSDARVATITVVYGTKSLDITLTQLADIGTVNEITYSTTTGEVLTLESYEGFGSRLVSNTYANGYGKMRFEGDITAIPTNAFKDCTTLSYIILPDTLESIGESAFEGCLALHSITIPTGVQCLDSSTFYNCISLAEVELGQSIEGIGDHCFALCSSLTSVALPDSVTEVGDYAFTDCTALTTVTLGSGIKSLGNNAFASCSTLGNVTLPEGMKSIGDYTFSNCEKIYSITIPATVESIGSCAFFNCNALYSIDCLATNVPTLGKYALHKYHFNNTHESGDAGNIEELSYTAIGSIIYVPATAVEAYQSADNWSDYATYIKTK